MTKLNFGELVLAKNKLTKAALDHTDDFRFVLVLLENAKRVEDIVTHGRKKMNADKSVTAYEDMIKDVHQNDKLSKADKLAEFNRLSEEQKDAHEKREAYMMKEVDFEPMQINVEDVPTSLTGDASAATCIELAAYMVRLGIVKGGN